MNLLPMYLRKEPSAEKGRFDVQAYRDSELTIKAGRWQWWNSKPPRKGCKKVMLNCYYWRAVWVE